MVLTQAIGQSIHQKEQEILVTLGNFGTLSFTLLKNHPIVRVTFVKTLPFYEGPQNCQTTTMETALEPIATVIKGGGRRVIIEGNIAAGKSTLLDRMFAEYPDQVCISKEPTCLWAQIKTEYPEQMDLIAAATAYPELHAFKLQCLALSTIASLRSEPVKPGMIRLEERSLASSHKVFGEVYKESMHRTEQDILNTMYNSMMNSAKGDNIAGILYIDIPIAASLARLKDREHCGDKEIDKHLLTKLEQAYKSWMEQCILHGIKVVRVSSDQTAQINLSWILENFGDV